jgi:hypothetical protein
MPAVSPRRRPGPIPMTRHGRRLWSGFRMVSGLRRNDAVSVGCPAPAAKKKARDEIPRLPSEVNHKGASALAAKSPTSSGKCMQMPYGRANETATDWLPGRRKSNAISAGKLGCRRRGAGATSPGTTQNPALLRTRGEDVVQTTSAGSEPPVADPTPPAADRHHGQTAATDGYFLGSRDPSLIIKQI